MAISLTDHRLDGAATEARVPEVVYRPLHRISTGALHAVEAVAMAEEPFVDVVCRHAARWDRSGLRPRVAFVLPVGRVPGDGVVDAAVDRLCKAPAVPRWPTVVVAHAALVADGADGAEGDDWTERLARLRRHGLRIAVDAFDGHHSSLARLHALAVDELRVEHRGLAVVALAALEQVESQSQLEAAIRHHAVVGRALRRGRGMAPEEMTTVLRRSAFEVHASPTAVADSA